MQVIRSNVRPEVSIISEMRKPRGWVLYDGRCPFCRRGARRLGGIVVSRGYRLAPLQRRWLQSLLAGRADRAGPADRAHRAHRAGPRAEDEFLLLLPDNRLLGGVDAVMYLAARVWWARPVALLLSIPVLNNVACRLYAKLAASRQRSSCAVGGGQCRAG